MLLLPLLAGIARADTMAVWGLAYRNLVEYPERGVLARELVDTLVAARDRYPLRMSLDEINSVADAATRYYRDHGYKFHSVIVPPQKPEQGLIEFDVVVATLGDVQVVRGDGVSAEAAAAVFKPYLGKPLYQPDIDSALLALKAQAATDAVAYYSRGSKPGEVRINIKLVQKTLAMDARLDNYGSESTGEERLLLKADWFSPLDRFDQLSAGVMAASGDETNLYGFVDYRAPLWHLDHTVSLSLSNNQFGLGEEFADLEFDGDARIAELGYQYALSRKLESRQQLSLTGSYKTTDYDSIFKDPTLEQDESATGLQLGWSWQYQPLRGAHSGQLAVALAGGDYEVDGLTDGSEPYAKTQFSGQYQLGLGQSGQRSASVLASSLRGQYAQDNLPSFEKLMLSGAYGARAFAPGFFAADSGALLTLQWQFPWLLGRPGNFTLAPFLFADAAYGEKLSVDGLAIDRARLAAAGAGIDVFWGDNWYAQLLAAGNLQDDVDSGLQPETMDLFMQLNYQWR